MPNIFPRGSISVYQYLLKLLKPKLFDFPLRVISDYGFTDGWP